MRVVDLAFRLMGRETSGWTLRIPWTRPSSGIGGDMSTYFAHSENSVGVKHDLVEHLKAVAELAAEFAGKFGAADLGYWAGLWHDFGKFHSAFQDHSKTKGL